MKRSTFLQYGMTVPILSSIWPMSSLHFLSTLSPTRRMPALFLGHGSPMNAIEDNIFVRGFREISQSIAQPRAILCISAHWETKGTKVTAMDMPRTIHDFGGFPPALSAVQYPAPGDPTLVKDIQKLITNPAIESDYQWGLDHGSWSVIKHLYPLADIPVLQLSLNVNMKPADHYALAQQLKPLRDRGVLIIGSGNMIHNLGMVAWDKLATSYAYDWAIDLDKKFKQSISTGDHAALINYSQFGKDVSYAIPTAEHYLPLLYTLGVSDRNEPIQYFNDAQIGGSLSMLSIKIG